MLSREIEIVLNHAFTSAHAKRHEFITVEHLLLALLSTTSVDAILKSCDCKMDLLADELTQYIDETISLIPSGVEREIQPTLGFQRVLQRAVFHVQASDKKEVTGENIFVALFSESDSQAVFLLKKQNIIRLDVVNYLAHGISRLEKNEDIEPDTIDETVINDKEQKAT
ncbi:MAG: ATP-dependent Clp protease ATP-binding subunit ClpA, partial [Methylococcales bacterium]|nr:ATP-dependent Clp protease ATP-binding subunit ClpA [Methylococcales bacterium]